MNDAEHEDIYDPKRWGLPPEAIADLGNRLRDLISQLLQDQDPQPGRTCLDLSARASADENRAQLR